MVTETDSLSSSSAESSMREIVVLPAPEGEDRMNISPRRASVSGWEMMAMCACRENRGANQGGLLVMRLLEQLAIAVALRLALALAPVIEGLGQGAAAHQHRARQAAGRDPGECKGHQ